MPDQRSLLRGRLASAIDAVVDVAARLDPPGARPAPPPLPPPAASVARPWTIAAAMEPIAASVGERVGPQRLASSLPLPEPPPPLEHHRSRLPAAIIGSSILGLVLIVVVALHLMQSTAGIQGPGHAPGQIALTGIRPVATAPPASGAVPQTQVSFPAGTSTVDIEVNSGRTAGQAPVQIVVTAGQPAQTIIQHDYVLNQSGSTVIPLSMVSGVFPPGDYRVTITYQNALLGTTSFAVH